MPLIRKTDAPPADAPHGEPDDTLRLLTSGTDDQRWDAARAAAGAPNGVGALGAALFGEADPRVRDAIFTSLVRVHSAESVEAILPHLRSDDANLRTGALDALRAMPEAAAPGLPALLSDTDPDVRLLACEILRGLPLAQAAPLLCDLLGREDQVNVCAAAVDVLAEIGGPEALPALASCAARFPNEPFLIFAIKAAQARLGSSSIV